ncbi:hypothetical protein VPH35_024351 [Triticum aestivum]
MGRAVRGTDLLQPVHLLGGARRGAPARPPVAQPLVRLPRVPGVPHGVMGQGLHQPCRLVRAPAARVADGHRPRPRPRLHRHRQPGQRRVHAQGPLRQLPKGQALRRAPRRPPRRRHLQRRRRRLAPPAQDGQPPARQRHRALLRLQDRRTGGGGPPPACPGRRRRQGQGSRPPGRVPAVRLRHRLQDLLRARPGMPRPRHAHVGPGERVRHRLAALRHAGRGGLAVGVEDEADAQHWVRKGAQEGHQARRRPRVGHDSAAPDSGFRQHPRPSVPLHGLGRRHGRQVSPRHRGQLPPRRPGHGRLRAYHALPPPSQEPSSRGRHSRRGRRRQAVHLRAPDEPAVYPRGAVREHAAVPAGAVRLQVLHRRGRAPGRHLRGGRVTRDVPPVRHGTHAQHLGRRLRGVPPRPVAHRTRRFVRAGEPVQVPGVPGRPPRVPWQGAGHN